MSRRKNRYERRKAKREQKKEYLKKYDSFEGVAGFKSLFYAALKSSRGVSWKASVQRYILGILFRTIQTRKKLLDGKDIRQGFIEFDICERGKTRHIRSVHFNERVVQKSICQNAMYPVLTNNVIYDNAASQKGKGTIFAEDRVTKHLRDFYRKSKNIGYVLLIDFKSYFDNIPHNILKQNFRANFTDNRLIKLADDFVDAFGERGLGLGSETSQINAIVHINRIDHYIKEVEKLKYYGRYMDDSYIIHQDKTYLKELLDKLIKMYAELGVIVNTKKTKITPLKRGFTFLKTRFLLTSTGKVIKKPCRESITRERRKLKKQAKLYKSGEMSMQEVLQSYNSWRGSMQHRNARKTLFNMDKLFSELFTKKEKENERSDDGR